MGGVHILFWNISYFYLFTFIFFSWKVCMLEYFIFVFFLLLTYLWEVCTSTFLYGIFLSLSSFDFISYGKCAHSYLCLLLTAILWWIVLKYFTFLFVIFHLCVILRAAVLWLVLKYSTNPLSYFDRCCE